jgi:hydroxyacylglutathione hydrolase
VFTGDGAGIFYPSLWPWGLRGLHLPTTTPPRFDPDAMLASLERVAALVPDRLYVTHFGAAAAPDRFLDECARDVRAWTRLGMEAASLDGVRGALRAWIEDALRARGVRDIEAAWRAADLDLDLELNSQGLWVYADRQRRR